MKYIVGLILSIFILATFAQDNSGKEQKLVSSEVEIATAKKSIRSIGTNFTTCSSDLNAFSDYPWFPDFKKAFGAIKIDTELSSLFLIDICFSSNLKKIIVNVPYVFSDFLLCHNDSVSDESPCSGTLNIYSYDIAKKSFTQVTRDPKTVNYQEKKGLVAVNQVVIHSLYEDSNSFWHADISTALRGFEKEEGNNIILTSEYGDAGCTQSYIWKYDYVNNLISLFENKSWCVEDTYYSTDTSLPTTGPTTVFLIFLVILSLFVGIKWKYYKL